ncbi:inositol monophosphatase family protein [Rhodococcus ruber]|uniref:inositol monophosphatase family protein n=1 Tax=Rhodococcus ruber TaxID=1830 RepID=UPI0007CD89FD|nr:inositol monophosphatase family protein [Rhodococcus ruber]AWH01482.1 histidinol phosphate phosphatase [Rhodococcus ruber]QRE79105.1 histidinol phosphate phosphatase [Rhodococcus ruber]
MHNHLSPTAESALSITRDAGEVARKWFETSGIQVETKFDGSPVTRADREVEDVFRSSLRELFPDDGIFGEEFGEVEGTSGNRWIIDPIDGTKSFVHAVPLYGNLLAYERSGEIVFGAMNFPSIDVMVYAEKGKGCWRNDVRVNVSERGSLDGAYLMATWLEDWKPETIRDLIDRGVVLRTWGDAFGYAMVASGHADVVVDYTTQPYDLAPMPVIISEAGGRFTALDGRPGYDRGTGIASNGLLHEAVLKLVN